MRFQGGTAMWRRPVALGVLALAACFATAALSEEAAKPTVFNFDADKAGEAAKGWEAAVGTWKVAADDTAPSGPNVLAQTAAGPGPQFNVALATAADFKNLDLSVRLKAVSGEKDQGGGPVWRAKDARNYYVCRWNPLEDNFRLYKVIDGKRTQLATADLKAPAGWRTLRVVMKGDAIECHLDGKKLLEAKDDALKDAGKVGLWTKADAATNFDDLTVSGR
jgi:hypothetical protein